MKMADLLPPESVPIYFDSRHTQRNKETLHEKKHLLTINSTGLEVIKLFSCSTQQSMKF